MITVAVGIGAVVVLAIVVLMQLHDVERRVTLQKKGECEHNATGPIARLFLNWMQATSLLSTIKLTPPDMVKDVSVVTDYAQGISTDWYFIACTIRLDVWTTFAWNLIWPLLAALVPALLVIGGTPVKRKVVAIGWWWSAWWAKARVSAVAEQHMHDQTMRADGSANDNDSGAAAEITVDDSGEPRDDASIAQLDETDDTDVAASDEPDSGTASSDENAAQSTEAHARRRIFDSRAGWFTNVSGRAIAVRDAPTPDAGRLDFAILPSDTFRAEEQRAVNVAPSTRVEYLRLAGEWGVGWIPMTFGRATAIIRVRASSIVTDAQYRRDAVPPAGFTQHDISSGGDNDSDSVQETSADMATQYVRGDIDEATHRFRALEALCPEGGINRDVIELIYPAETPQKQLDEVFDMFDDDGDGRLSMKEYRAADLTIRTTWRYRHLWHRFAAADVNRDGVLTDEEVLSFTPITVTKSGTAAWIAPFDTAGQFGAITIADLPALDRAAYWDNIWTIVGAAVSMSVFVVYIRTTAAIMTMFSTETIEGRQYMKRDFSTLAWSSSHLIAIAIGSIYGFFFVVGIPIVAIYVLFLNHGQKQTRHIQAVFGFLFEGYRPRMYFWEFSVLLRKVVFLAISLFWEDAFLQSVVAVFAIIISITLHTSFWPYEQTFLNLVELMSLFSLFSLVVLSLLLWYIQMPGNDTHLAYYELMVTFILFVQYSLVGTLLVGWLLYIKVREISDKLVHHFPATRSMFLAAARFETLVYFKLHGEVNSIGQEKLWTFIAADLVAGKKCESDAETTLVSTDAKLRALQRVCCQACRDRRAARAEERSRAQALVQKRVMHASTTVQTRVRRTSVAAQMHLRRRSIVGANEASAGAIEMTATPTHRAIEVRGASAFSEGGAVESVSTNLTTTSVTEVPEEGFYLVPITHGTSGELEGPHTLAWLRASLLDEFLLSTDTVRWGKYGEDEELNIVLHTNNMFDDGWYYADESDETEFAGPFAFFELKEWVRGGFLASSILVRQGERGKGVAWVEACPSAASAHDQFVEAFDAVDLTPEEFTSNPIGKVWFFTELDGDVDTPYTLAELRGFLVEKLVRGTATVRRGEDGDSVPLSATLLDAGMFQDGWYLAELPDAPFEGPFALWEMHEWLVSEGEDTSRAMGLVRQGLLGLVLPVGELPREETDAEDFEQDIVGEMNVDVEDSASAVIPQ